MIKLDLVYIVDFSIFLQGNREVVECLLIAFIIKIRLSQVMMGSNQIELGFAMSVYKNLGMKVELLSTRPVHAF